MTDKPKSPEELVTPNTLHTIEPGMVLRSTKTSKLLLVTVVNDEKLRGKPITQDGELEDPNPDKWIEMDIDVARKYMIEQRGIDVSKLQGYVQGKIESALN